MLLRYSLSKLRLFLGISGSAESQVRENALRSVQAIEPENICFYQLALEQSTRTE